jgi:hypothetical protein
VRFPTKWLFAHVPPGLDSLSPGESAAVTLICGSTIRALSRNPADRLQNSDAGNLREAAVLLRPAHIMLRSISLSLPNHKTTFPGLAAQHR